MLYVLKLKSNSVKKKTILIVLVFMILTNNLFLFYIFIFLCANLKKIKNFTIKITELVLLLMFLDNICNIILKVLHSTTEYVENISVLLH